jgi:hypothetical protein
LRPYSGAVGSDVRAVGVQAGSGTRPWLLWKSLNYDYCGKATGHEAFGDQRFVSLSNNGGIG